MTLPELVVDDRINQVTYNGRALKLPYREYELLALLARAKGAVVDYFQISTWVWGEERHRASGAIRVVLMNIRNELRPGTDIVLTIPRRGLRINTKAVRLTYHYAESTSDVSKPTKTAEHVLHANCPSCGSDLSIDLSVAGFQAKITTR